mmetsp:Transcript_6521/g.13367  ORF Transcript_6521/g.13367 Transcript_6521/m.13367 type:complete len:134 (+) Transcript_6521:46-447(+)
MPLTLRHFLHTHLKPAKVASKSSSVGSQHTCTQAPRCCPKAAGAYRTSGLCAVVGWTQQHRLVLHNPPQCQSSAVSRDKPLVRMQDPQQAPKFGLLLLWRTASKNCAHIAGGKDALDLLLGLRSARRRWGQSC